MKTFNLKANMKTPKHLNAGADQIGGSCGRESAANSRREVSRAVASAATALLCLAWLALPGRALAQPADYANETNVAAYVNGMLYWPAADATNRNIAAFRYKTLLYTAAGGLAPVLTNMVTLYGNAERTRAATAETYLRQGLLNNPASPLLAGLLLDLYYDRTAAEFILAANSLTGADRARMGPPAVPTGLVIDDEIGLYQSALAASELLTCRTFWGGCGR